MKINSNKIKSLVLLSLVGSNLAKEEKTDNQSELTLNSLPQIGANLTKRQDNSDPILIFGGYPISITEQGGGCGNDICLDDCTAGFAIVFPDENASSSCSLGGGGSTGFITSVNCCPSQENWEDCSSDPVWLNSKEHKNGIGYVVVTSLTYSYPIELDFAVVYSVPALVKFLPYVVGENNDLIPITSYGSASVGEKVCAYTATGGHVCGKVTNETNGFAIKVIMEVDSNVVDYGGSVYKKTNIGERAIAQLVGHITDNDDYLHNISL